MQISRRCAGIITGSNRHVAGHSSKPPAPWPGPPQPDAATSSGRGPVP